MVQEAGVGVPTGGKPPTLIELNAAGRSIVVLDLGCAPFVGIVNEQGEILEAANLGWQNRMVLAVSEVAPTIAVVLRTPFDLSSYPEIQTYLCTYSILRPSLDALADVLAGIAEASGRLPSPIGDLFPTGHGLGQATVRR